MMTTGWLPYVKVERVTRVAALGVRFFDPIRGRIVSDLAVNAYWSGTTRRPQMLPAGPSGIYLLHTAGAKWAAVEAAAAAAPPGDNTFWDRLPGPQPALLAVNDPTGRFLPFTVPAPVPPPGTRPGRLFVPDCLLSSPNTLPATLMPGAPDAVPLFAAPGGPVPEGMAVVRADLQDLASGKPAVGAVLEVRFEGSAIGWGIADSRGVAVAVLPYPEPADFTPGSPGMGESPFAQTWELEIAVAWQAPPSPPGGPVWAPLPGAADTSKPYLDLCAAWGQLRRPFATVWASRTPDQALTTAVLHANQDLILSTVVGGRSSSRLLITPAA